jgi:hypothetical protein
VSKNPIDSLKLGDIIAWLRANKLVAMAVLGLGGANFLHPKPETTDTQIVMAVSEYNELVQGLIQSCQR